MTWREDLEATSGGNVSERAVARLRVRLERADAAYEAWQKIGERAAALLVALQPWELQTQTVRTAAVFLTTALASSPEREETE